MDFKELPSEQVVYREPGEEPGQVALTKKAVFCSNYLLAIKPAALLIFLGRNGGTKDVRED